ncbi:uncharacterized protein LOC100367813 [Saccoglossus kowalevskii]
MKNPNYEGSDVTGNIYIRQVDSEKSEIKIELEGLSAHSSHGFHVHEKGDLSDGCESTAGHYNPFDMDHGAPTDKIRHVGDLGNIVADAKGRVSTIITDDQISLVGSYSIIGRAFVVHEGEDDLGKGGDEGSRTTGNAGKRMACCVVGRTDKSED